MACCVHRLIASDPIGTVNRSSSKRKPQRESEFFGHERGAFSGAIVRMAGRFEVADKGTLFLDEVGDIPLELQPKLLRVRQEHEFERLGSTRRKKVDVRAVAATHRNLEQMVEDREFRSDLYYRLYVFPLTVPPLRFQCARSVLNYYVVEQSGFTPHKTAFSLTSLRSALP